MSFTRTNSGITNGHLFYDAEIIVYTEGGGRSISIEDVEKGIFNSKSIDIKFWNGLFSAAKFNKKVEFRALGSKTASKIIREKIISNSIRNVAVVIDRDLDFIKEPLPDSPFILYTKGYSWENDVYSKDNTIDQLNSFVLEQDLSERIKGEVSLAYDDYMRISRRLLRLEIIFRRQNKRFITELKGERFFDSKRSPRINKGQVLKLIKEKKNELPTRPAVLDERLGGLCPMNNSYGKLLTHLSLAIVSFFCKRHSSITSIPFLLFESSMLERYIHKQVMACDDYYKTIIDRLDTA
ncbi:hypothetical protein [Rheinheimera faecalis]|uniref:hypothetical protein n=1 Tax=Rheinheimera faecalis TaxID=2901141 RepID=UPI001E2FB230|nr:hypothetical protein [Rheinheimera faecalis]